jgi:hypothetical protein
VEQNHQGGQGTQRAVAPKKKKKKNFPLTRSLQNLSKILLASLTPYVNEITGDHKCGFCHNSSNTDQIFYICKIPEEKLKYNGTVHQLFKDLKKAYD